MNSSKNNGNSLAELDDDEKCANKLAEKRTSRKLARRTNEIIEMESTLLTCLSSEIVKKFNEFLNKIFDPKCAEGSLICYQIVLNSLLALHQKQYPSYSEQTIQEMNNSLLQKIFQKMALENYECTINCDENDLIKKRCHSELLCLLEMYILRFTTPTNAPINNKIQDIRKSTTNNASTSYSSIGIINFLSEPRKQPQKKINARPFHCRYKSIMPTQLATKNIVARLRHLYLLCTDPEQFHQFIEDVLCDEFIEELPFYLVSIYEQLGIEIPTELEPFKPQESNQQKNGRPLRIDLRDYKNKQTDKLEYFLMKIKKFDDESENWEKGTQNTSINIKEKKRGTKLKNIDNSMKKQLTLAPKKPQIQSRTLIMGRRFGNGKTKFGGGTTRFGNSAPKKIIDPPAGISELRQNMKTGKQLAKRRILAFVPETPEKKIDCEREKNKNGENEIVEQTPLGKIIAANNSSLARKLAELLIREEMRQMSQLREEILEENMAEFTSFAIDDLKENENNKNSSTLLNVEPKRPKQCAENSLNGDILGRKRPLTPSENNSSSSMTDLLQMKEKLAKRPCRRIFPSSRCSTISSTTIGGIAFPFKGRQS